jgi:hypothetical protein
LRDRVGIVVSHLALKIQAARVSRYAQDLAIQLAQVEANAVWNCQVAFPRQRVAPMAAVIIHTASAVGETHLPETVV